MNIFVSVQCFIALITGSGRAAGPLQFSCTAGATLKIEAGMFNLIGRP